MKSKTEKIKTYLMNNPDAKPAAVAAKFKVSAPYIYNLRKKVMNDFFSPPGLLPVPPAPEIINPEPDPVDKVLDARALTYGSFEENAKTAQTLNLVLHRQEGWYHLSFVQREALEMIMHKVSRLVNGDPTYLDTVVDIAGYTELMLKDMRNRNAQKMDQ